MSKLHPGFLSTPGRLLLAGLLLWLLPVAADNHTAPESAFAAPPLRDQAWLVTYAPGDIYWQRFGHNAIWIQDRRQGINHLFNFGFFDFNQPGFLRRFVQGRMLYFAVARPWQQEFAEYQAENRSIHVQPLNLTPEQFGILRDYLIEQVQPENRDYRYDYFLANCSTRLRDALDLALGGALQAQSGGKAARNFRDHVNLLSAPDPLLYLGLAVGLGSPTDREISHWEEAFIPQQLSDLAAATENPVLDAALAGEPQLVYQGGNTPSGDYSQRWFVCLLLGGAFSLLLILLSLPVRNKPQFRRWRLLPATLWLSISGLAGGLLLYLWLGTDHAAAYRNWNLLLLNPLNLLLAVLLLVTPKPAVSRVAGLLLLASYAGAVIIALIPLQKTLPVVAFCALPVAVSCWILLPRRQQSPALRN